jgi:hypothetical protein
VKIRFALRFVLAGAALWTAAGCSSRYQFETAVVHFYELKIATNGERMTKGALDACQADPGCTADERRQLRQSWTVARNDYRAKRAAVERDRAAGYHANMSNLPDFGRDPSLGFDSL